MVTPGGYPLDPSKLSNVIILESLWVHEALGQMLTRIVSNSDFGKRPGALHMITRSSHVLLHVTNNVFTY